MKAELRISTADMNDHFISIMNLNLLHLLSQDPGFFVVSSEKNRKFAFSAGEAVEREGLALDDAGQGSILVRQFLK